MLEAILFDLDNTLILFDELELLKQYLPKVSRVFADVMPFDEFRRRILSSTQALVGNAGKMSNADFFMDHFCHGYEDRRDEFWNRFIAFYSTSFSQFQQLTIKIDGVRELFDRLEAWPLKKIIASNPFWPRIVQAGGMAGGSHPSIRALRSRPISIRASASVGWYQGIPPMSLADPR